MAWILKRHRKGKVQILYDDYGMGEEWLSPVHSNLLPAVFETKYEADFERKVYERMEPDYEYEVTEYLR